MGLKLLNENIEIG
jgi:serine/threonine protein kinase